MNVSQHIIVKGRVQGVAFRANTFRQAKHLNLHGYVKNLANGDVEIVAKGESAALALFLAWCQHGPEYAQVNQVLVNEYNVDDLPGYFEIK